MDEDTRDDYIHTYFLASDTIIDNRLKGVCLVYKKKIIQVHNIILCVTQTFCRNLYFKYKNYRVSIN